MTAGVPAAALALRICIITVSSKCDRQKISGALNHPINAADELHNALQCSSLRAQHPSSRDVHCSAPWRPLLLPHMPAHSLCPLTSYCLICCQASVPPHSGPSVTLLTQPLPQSSAPRPYVSAHTVSAAGQAQTAAMQLVRQSSW